jgi:hypothetical protein
MSDHMQRCLQAYYTHAFPAKQGLQGQLTWSISLPAGKVRCIPLRCTPLMEKYGPDEGRQRQALVLRLYLGDHTHAKSAHEFLNMRQLHQAGYPVPSVHLLEPTNSPLASRSPLWRGSQGR